MNLLCPRLWPNLVRLSPTIRILLFTGWLTCITCISASAQTNLNINGKVKDDKGDPVPGASVVVKGSNAGTSSDSSGNFKITVPGQRAVLVISSVGHQSVELTVTGSGLVNVTLIKRENASEEVVVVGFGTQKKVDVTGAISSISGDRLNQGVNNSVANSLQGQAAGVTVIQNSGEPGGGVNIVIRGTGTINDNSPLYVVDGIISPGIGGLNPADVENISILKDAASAAIYGSRGGNGVVIVTTKKGRRNQKTNISLNTSQGVQSAWRMPSALSAADRNLIHKEALTNDGTPTSDPIWDYYNDPDHAITRTDWFKEILKPGYISTQDLAIRGGSGQSNYSFSLGFLNNDGILKGSKYKRYNLRFNSQHELIKNLTFGENISVVLSNTKYAETRGDYDGVLSAAMFNFRDIPVYEDPAINKYGSPSGDFPNPVASVNSRDNVTKGTTIFGNAYLEYKFLNMFTVKTDIAYNWEFAKNKNFVAIANGGGRGLTQNSLSENYATNNVWIWNNTLSFDKTFDRHHVTALVGMSAESGLYESTGVGAALDFSNQDPALRYYNNAGNFPNHAGGGADDYTLQGYFGRVTYEYADKYLLAANIRRDGSSKFGPDHRWGTFPSISGGWKLSKEDFFPWKDEVSELKIRASWGQLGNDKIPNYQYFSTVNSVGSPTLNGVPYTAVAQNSLSNPDIHWETTTQTDVGIDLGLFRNRVSLTADYFNRRTSDILVQVPLVGSYGVGIAPFQNAGVVSNKGFEFSATYRSVPSRKFNYQVTANVATVKNKLETLGVEGSHEIFVSNYKNTLVGRVSEGEAIGHFYVLQALGIFQSQAEVDAYKNKDGDLIQPNAVAGDIKFADANNDGAISAKDRVNAGNSFPKFTYSFNIAASYTGFDFSMFWTGSQGNKIFNGMKLGEIFMQGTSYNNGEDILDRWTASSGGNSIPRVTVKDLNSNKTFNTLYIEDGSFLRMKYLTVGYTFGDNIIGKKIQKLRAYVTLQNLVTITKYKGFDPEIGADVNSYSNMYGVDRGAYPQAKAFMVGINFNF
jgi:TonB-dependent starch-binding outer membrane protein SusC